MSALELVQRLNAKGVVLYYDPLASETYQQRAILGDAAWNALHKVDVVAQPQLTPPHISILPAFRAPDGRTTVNPLSLDQLRESFFPSPSFMQKYASTAAPVVHPDSYGIHASRLDDDLYGATIPSLPGPYKPSAPKSVTVATPRSITPVSAGSVSGADLTMREATRQGQSTDEALVGMLGSHVLPPSLRKAEGTMPGLAPLVDPNIVHGRTHNTVGKWGPSRMYSHMGQNQSRATKQISEDTYRHAGPLAKKGPEVELHQYQEPSPVPAPTASASQTVPACACNKKVRKAKHVARSHAKRGPIVRPTPTQVTFPVQPISINLEQRGTSGHRRAFANVLGGQYWNPMPFGMRKMPEL